jgi:hypothetical protein
MAAVEGRVAEARVLVDRLLEAHKQVLEALEAQNIAA